MVCRRVRVPAVFASPYIAAGTLLHGPTVSAPPVRAVVGCRCGDTAPAAAVCPHRRGRTLRSTSTVRSRARSASAMAGCATLVAVYCPVQCDENAWVCRWFAPAATNLTARDAWASVRATCGAAAASFARLFFPLRCCYCCCCWLRDSSAACVNSFPSYVSAACLSPPQPFDSILNIPHGAARADCPMTLPESPSHRSFGGVGSADGS